MLKYGISHSSLNMKLRLSWVEATLRVQSLKSPEQMDSAYPGSSVGRRTALERVAYLLLFLYDRADELKLTKDGKIQLPITQQHLADALGLSLVHTNKTLKRLLVTKSIRWQARTFEMLDRAALADLAGGDTLPTRKRRPFI